ncbi:MAG: type II toxin-antitoxin system prevent-host-death family antitoxin [Desulfuromonadales bacterium]|nr:type II toxin-antitoxin system prevent-host-death family antitoxin [Desulfuromonadales bacterium]
MKQVSKSQFKPRSLEYFRVVEQTGEELVITDHGRPVAKVIPYREDAEERLLALRETVLRYERPLDSAVDEDEWESAR